MWISQILERVSDEALKNLSREKIAKVFPKQFSNAKSHLVLKIPNVIADGLCRPIAGVI